MFGQYGSERNDLIARSKIVLNLHGFSALRHMEQVRIAYLLNNEALVISEHSHWNPYNHGLLSYAYEDLIEGIRDWLARPAAARREQAREGLKALQVVPFRERLAAALADLS